MIGTSTEPAGRIMVVEDDESVRTLAATCLRLYGYHVETADRGDAVLEAIRSGAPDLVILDVNLPGMDGFTVCRRLRATGSQVPVVFLTARREPSDIRQGYLGGADDYITKPFSIEEMRLRVSAVLRRTGVGGCPRQEQLRCGPVEVDEQAHLVFSAGEQVHLTPTEFKLLVYLLSNVDRVLSRVQIVDRVWPQDFDGDWQIVETYVSSLRRKLREPQVGRVIHTVRGVGYCARPPS